MTWLTVTDWRPGWMNCTASVAPTLKLRHSRMALALLCVMVVFPVACWICALPWLTTPPTGADRALSRRTKSKASTKVRSANKMGMGGENCIYFLSMVGQVNPLRSTARGIKSL